MFRQDPIVWELVGQAIWLIAIIAALLLIIVHMRAELLAVSVGML